MSKEDPFADRLRLRCCALVAEEKKLLLIRQNVPTRSQPIWLPPGGELNLGESIKEAAIRETKEETGLQIKTSHIVAIHEFIEKPYHALEIYFAASVTGGKLKTGSDPELHEGDQQIITCRFINMDKLPEMDDLFPEFLRGNVESLLNRESGKTYHFGI